MEFFDVLALRQSVRAYTEEAVSPEDTARLVEAAQYAPVGMHNHEGYLITVISNPEIIAEMRDTYTKITGKAKDPIFGAPLFIAVSATPKAIEELKKYDAACIVENIHLAAAAIGLGSCYIHGMVFAIRQARAWQQAAGIPEDATPICGIAVGHSLRPVHPRPAGENFAVSYAR